MVKPSDYSPIDSLVDLACRDGVDVRPTLLRVVTDLFVQKPAHTADEEIQYVELALGLIEAADAPTRAAVAASLRNYPNAPAVVLNRLDASSAPAGREETVPDDLTELFFAASPEERRLILVNLDLAGSAARAPAPAGDTIGHLEAAALQRNPGEFTHTLERALGVTRALAERVARDSSGEPLVIAAKSLGMPAAVLQRILLFLDPAIGHSIERVYDLAQLFDELRPQAAFHMVAIWQAAHARPRPAHEPVNWDDERRGARPASGTARQRAARDRKEQSGRSKSGNRQA